MSQTNVNFTEAAGVSNLNPSSHYNLGSTASHGSYTDVVLKFPEIQGNLKYKNIKSAKIYLYFNSHSGSITSETLYATAIDTDSSIDAITYSKAEQVGYNYNIWVYQIQVPGWRDFSDDLKSIIKYNFGIMVDAPYYFTFYTPSGANKPYIQFEHDDDILGVDPYGLYPTNYAPQSINQKFNWYFSTTGFTLATLSPVSTKFQWRVNESSEIHEIDANNGLNVTIPAGDLPAGTIQIRVTVTANSGVTKSTQWYNLEVLPPRIESPTPSSGYVPKNKASEFSWSLVQPTSNTAKQKATQISAVFKWRAYDGAQIHEIPVSGSTTKVTVPANTFTTASFQWMVTATANGGATASSDWMTCSTLEVTSHARAVSPKSTVIQSGAEIVFTWEHIITTGTAPTGFDIQYSTDKSDWRDLLSGKTSETTATLKNNALPGGTVYWRVRTYNTDNAPGAWSDPAEIIVIAPPAAPTIQLEKISPRPIIRWSSLDQVAYEVEIVGVEKYSQYGNANRYQSHAVLADDLYTVRVRIQNRYAFWSAWAEASLTVFNSPSGSISLMATASKTGEVQLSWSATGAFISFQILRNGAVIGETTERSYLDRLAIGACSYQIRGIVDSAGNYSLSGVQALTVTVPTVAIAPISGGDWLALPYTTTDIREVTVSISKTVTYQQFLGASLPVGVVGEALSKSVQLSCAFPYRLQADAAKLEALIGQLVCVKDPRGRRYLGILGSMSHVSSRFYLSYNLIITPVDCEEVEL